MDRVHNRICPCFSFRALRAAGVCTVVFPFGCRANSHLHRCKGILGARRGSASCAGIEIRRFRSPPGPCSALSDAGTQFFAGRVGRRDDGASGPGQTDSHDPRPAKPCAFSFGPCTARFLFGKTKRKWGVHSPRRARSPLPGRWWKMQGRRRGRRPYCAHRSGFCRELVIWGFPPW